MTGIYRCQTVFYGLTDMPAEFQKAMDYTLIRQKKNIDFNEAPVNNNRAIGLVEGLIQTIMSGLACIEGEKLATNSFHMKHALKIIIHQLRICKKKTTKILPFEKQI